MNRSVHELQLSMNILSDVTFMALLQSIAHNIHTKLTIVDVSHNMISCGNDVQNYFKVFVPHHKHITDLKIFAGGNFIGYPRRIEKMFIKSTKSTDERERDRDKVRLYATQGLELEESHSLAAAGLDGR